MDLEVNEFIDGLLSEEASTKPSDTVKVEDLDLEMRLPDWFDEEKYNNGRCFFHDYSFGFGANMILGLLAVFSVPSIMKVLVGTRRSSSPYTAYKRYVSTLMHVMSWYEHELKPGSVTWQSLHAVRSRHLRAAKEATLKGYGTVSQRDLALTQFGFVGFAILKADKYSIRQIRKGDWEGFNHFWSTIGYMLGLEDRFNLCRKNIKETREVCQIVADRVFTPCLENVPEHFEHMCRVLIEALGTFVVHFKVDTLLYSTKYVAKVPGYIFTEEDRIEFQNKLEEKLKGKSEDIGVDTASLMSKCAVDGLPNRPPRLLYLRDFDSVETSPRWGQLSFGVKYQLTVLSILNAFYNTEIGRVVLNWVYRANNYIAFNFPYKAMFKFGFMKSFVNMFVEDPKDDTEPRLNEEFYKPYRPETWYEKVISIVW